MKERIGKPIINGYYKRKRKKEYIIYRVISYEKHDNSTGNDVYVIKIILNNLSFGDNDYNVGKLIPNFGFDKDNKYIWKDYKLTKDEVRMELL